MLNSYLKITKKKETATLPKKATHGSAGFDLFSCIDEPIIIAPTQQVLVPTGIAISLKNPCHVGLIFARSGLSIKHGITLSNGVGVIDSDYRGEIFVGLCNIGKDCYEIKSGERIAQLVIVPILNPQILEVSSINNTTRGCGGFGSTGK